MTQARRKRSQPARAARGARPRAKSRPRSRTGSFDARRALPYFLSFCILVCLIAIATLGYRSAASSKFFDVATVSIAGTDRASKTEIESIVRSETERTGVWNADLGQIKTRIEKLSFVRSAAVSRVLPNTVQISIEERVPAAIVDLASGPTLVDAEGAVIAPSIRPEGELPFMLVGWDEHKTLQAEKENRTRVKMYRTMLAEWRQAGLVDRVISVNTKDVRDPMVLTEDSGKKVAIAVGRDSFGENLKNGLMAIRGKGETFEGVALFGTNLRLVPRQTK